MASFNTRSRKVGLPEEDLNKQDFTVNTTKRLAEEALNRDNDKRSAFGDLTNAAVKKNFQALVVKKEKKVYRKLCKSDKVKLETTDSSIKSSQEGSSKDSLDGPSDGTLFLSALDNSQLNDSPAEKRVLVLPPGVEDFDRATSTDPYAESNYAHDIFEYYKQREKSFRLDKYLERQPELSKGMRSILTDWLVEVQESFELNHETLYLAVKLVDHYLMRTRVSKAQLQLLGATAAFIACKFDERSPPLIDDFLYICDDAYKREEMIHMELNLIKTLNFDLGIPLSYRFLRRYARCAKLSMEVLTLARFILESSLMDYDLITEPDSKIAAAALCLALAMKKTDKWNSTLEFYSGYCESELSSLVFTLNKIISQPLRSLKTVKVKYSHKVFFEVANIPPLKLSSEPSIVS